MDLQRLVIGDVFFQATPSLEVANTILNFINGNVILRAFLYVILILVTFAQNVLSYINIAKPFVCSIQTFGNVINILLYKQIKEEMIAPKRPGYWDTELMEEKAINHPQYLLKSSKKGTPKCSNKRREEFRAKSLQERKQEAIDLLSGDSQDQENPGKIQCTSTKKCRHKKREEFMEKSLHEKRQESLDRSLNEDSEEEQGDRMTKCRSRKRKEFLVKSLKERRQEGLDRSILDDAKKDDDNEEDGEQETLGEVPNLDDKFVQVYKEILYLSVVESSILDREEKDLVSQVDELLQEANCVLESVDNFITHSQMANRDIIKSDLEESEKDIQGEEICENLQDDQKLALQLVDTVLVVLLQNVDKILEKDDAEPNLEVVEEAQPVNVKKCIPEYVEEAETEGGEEVEKEDVEEVETEDVEETETEDGEDVENEDVEEVEKEDVEDVGKEDVVVVETKDDDDDTCNEIWAEKTETTDEHDCIEYIKAKKSVSTIRKTEGKPFLAAKIISHQRTALKNLRKDMKKSEANLQLKRLTKTSFIKKLDGMDGKEIKRTFTNVTNLNLSEGNEREQIMRTFTNKKNLPITNDASKDRKFTNRKNLPLTAPKTQERTFTNRNNLSIHKKSKLVNKQDSDELSVKINSTSKTVTKVFPKTASKVSSKTAPKVSSKTVTKVALKTVSNCATNKIDTFNIPKKVDKLPTNQRKVSISRSFTIKKENSTKKTEVKIRPAAKGRERRVGTTTKPNWKIDEEKENVEKKSGGILEKAEKEILIGCMKTCMENKIEPSGGQVKSLKKEIESDFNASYDELDGIRQYLNKTNQQNTPGTL